MLHTIIYAAAVGLLLAYVLPAALRRWRFVRALNRLPGPRSYPIIGTTWMFMGVGRDEMYEHMQVAMEPWPLARTWMGHIGTVNFTRAEHFELILGNSSSSGSSSNNGQPAHGLKNFQYRFVKPWLGDGLLTTDSTAAWHMHRKVITPAFHFGILEGFCEVFAERSAVLVERMAEVADTGREVAVYPMLSLAALEMIAEAAMGTKLDVQTQREGETNEKADRVREYVASVYEATQLLVARGMRPWLHPDWLFGMTATGKSFNRCKRVLHAFTDDVIAQRRAARLAEQQQQQQQTDATVADADADERPKKRLAFLDLLLEGNQLSPRELREEVDTFMFAGHDTTTANIAWTVWLLANHPEVQERIYAELQELDAADPATTNTTIRDLNNMKYLERVVKESLRLYPSAPIIGRILTEPVWADGYEIPTGTAVMLHIHKLHRDERWFEEPDRFDPDRWLPERSAGRHAFAYVPFSAGSRNCLGQKFAMYEEKTVLAALVRNFRFGVPEGTRVADEKQVLEVTAKPARGVPVLVRRR